MDYTKKVSEFVAQTTYGSLPAKAIELAKQAILDSVAVTLAGSVEPAAKICAQMAREESTSKDSSVFGQGFKTSCSQAALVNGTAGHALDYDYNFVYMGQPTSCLAAATFALSEKLEKNGRDFLEAYVVGFEVTTKLVCSIPDHSSKESWHSAGTLGALGAAVACAKLLRLEVEAVRTTLGIAASMASGFIWNYGTMTKPLHAGLAARNGVLAAKLASSGFTANRSILEGARGFHESYSRGSPYDLAVIESLGKSFELVEREIGFKAYPCGGLTHSAVDAVLEMRAEQGLAPEMIDDIHVGVTPHTYSKVLDKIPETAIQSKFSMGYILARAVIDGRVTLDTFTEEAIRDTSVIRLAEKVHMEVDPELEEDAEGSRPSKVSIRLKDGRTLSGRVDYAKGTAKKWPLTPEELRDKFINCARRALTEKAVPEAAAMIEKLETLDSVAPLCRLLAGNASLNALMGRE
jgi:2-methylcitrate dehydratase PrpD